MQYYLNLLNFPVVPLCRQFLKLVRNICVCSFSKLFLNTTWLLATLPSLTAVCLICCHATLEMWKGSCEPMQVAWIVMEKCSCWSSWLTLVFWAPKIGMLGRFDIKWITNTGFQQISCKAFRLIYSPGRRITSKLLTSENVFRYYR